MGGVATHREEEVVRRRLRGESGAKIAKALNVSYQAIHETLQKAHVQAAIMGANEDAVQAILAMRGRAAQVAFKTLIRLAEGEPDEDGEYTVPHAVQKQAASDLLDRLGIVREVAVKPGADAGGLLPSNLSPAQLKAIAWGEGEEEVERENAIVVDLVPDEPTAP